MAFLYMMRKSYKELKAKSRKLKANANQLTVNN